MAPPGSQEGVLKDLALSLNSVPCMEPLLVQHFNNFWGKYYCRAQPVSPGSALCSIEVELNILRSCEPSLQCCGQHSHLPQCGTQLLSTSAKDAADVAQQVTASFSSQLHQEGMQGWLWGRVNPRSPHLVLSSLLPALPGPFPSFSRQQPFPPSLFFSPLLGGCLIAWLPSLA